MDTPLPDNQGFLLQMYREEQFSRDALEQFPELKSELEENENLLHGQMWTLGSAVRRALPQGDASFILRVFRFLDGAVAQPRAISEIETAIALSFVTAQEVLDAELGVTLVAQLPQRVWRILADDGAQR